MSARRWRRSKGPSRPAYGASFALEWAKSVGGLKGMTARADANAAVVQRWIDARPHARNLAKIDATERAKISAGFTLDPARAGPDLRLPNVVVAAAWPLGVLRSMDGGTTWQSMFQSQATLMPVVVSGTAVFVGSDNGVWRSLDSGDTWTAYGLSGESINGLAMIGDSVYVHGPSLR